MEHDSSFQILSYILTRTSDIAVSENKKLGTMFPSKAGLHYGYSEKADRLTHLKKLISLTLKRNNL